jgi:hypothetical protein
MRQRIQFPEKARYTRIVARIPADLGQACSRLSKSQGWELGDLYRSLILLGAWGSYLTLRSPKPSQPTPDSSFSGVLERHLGGRAYAPRTGRRSKIMTAYLPIGVARWLDLYSKLTSRLRSHVYTRFLRAGLLIYLTCEQRLAEALRASSLRVSADTDDDRR